MKRFILLLPLLTACAPAAECAVQRQSTDPKVEAPIWEPAACPARVVRPVVPLVNDRDGSSFAPPVVSIPDPLPEEPKEPIPDPKPGQEPVKGDGNGKE